MFFVKILKMGLNQQNANALPPIFVKIIGTLSRVFTDRNNGLLTGLCHGHAFPVARFARKQLRTFLLPSLHHQVARPVLS